MTDSWGAAAAAYLSRADLCPRCSTPVTQNWCTGCRADFTSAEASGVRELSLRIAAELRQRETLIAGLPSRVDAAEPVGLAAAGSLEPAARARPAAARVRERGSVTLQSVMAVAGAGLLAVAAIVFSYLNPDFTDVGARSVVLLAVTALMIGGAALLIRFGLRFSAEAIGALGGVFVALDIQSVAELTGTDASPFVLAALGCVVGATLLGVLGVVVGLRAWVWFAVSALTLAPALWGYAAAEPFPTLGHLAAIAVSLTVQPVLTRLAGRMDSRLRAARVTSTVLRQLATATVLVELIVSPYPVSGAARALLSAAVLLVLATFSALGGLVQLRRLGTTLAGVLAVAATATAASALPVHPVWAPAILPVGAGLGAALVALLPLGRRVPRGWLVGGAATATAAVAVVPLFSLLRIGAEVGSRVAFGDRAAPSDPVGTATVLGLVGVGAAGAALWRIARRSIDTERLARIVLGVGLSAVPLTGLALLVAPEYPVDAALALALVPATASSVALLLWKRVAQAPLAFRAPLIIAAHLLPIAVAPLVPGRAALLLPLAAAVLVAWTLAAAASPRVIRPLHAVSGEVFALVIVAAALTHAGISGDVVVPVVAIAGALVALAAVLVSRVAPDYRLGAIAVAVVPLGIAVLAVIEVRTGWTAASSLASAVLAAVLLAVVRSGVGRVVRTFAGAVVVPSIAVALVCLGAQLLAVSASPVVLPLIAGLVAVALPTTGGVARLLSARGIPEDQARAVRLAIEASALATGAIGVALALTRVAAGPDTAFAVLVIIGLGSVATALFAHRRYGWVVAFASFTGALWTFLGIARVGIPEAYALPPTLAAALIGAVLVARGRLVAAARTLFATGLAVAPLPTLGVLALAGDGSPGPVPWRMVGLLGGAVLLLGAAIMVGRPVAARLRPLRAALVGVGMLAAAAGPVQGVRFGRWLDLTALGFSSLVVWPALGVGVLGAGLAALGGTLLARERPADLDSGIRRRWMLLPALTFLVAGPISATHRGWAPIWILWSLALLLLVLMLAVADRSARRPTSLPPVWALFLLAWITAVAGWSMRDLRVEVFSLPLGLTLLGTGVIGMRTIDAPLRRRTPGAWPHAFRGSWWLLTPGLVATLLPSMLATGTDPQTWRAVVVLALALTSILIGSLRRLAAPFVLGIVVLPLENLIVFGAQLGRAISATSWWISLATAGAVLLVIAVTSERRSGRGRGIAARMRDLG